MKDLACPAEARYYSLYINCGGGQISYDGNDYVDDTSTGSPSYFSSTGNQWALSSTGNFMYNDDAAFTASNTYNLSISGPEYFQTARVSASTLKYYGLCLRKGTYTVQLYFAEIMFSNDKTYASLGNRIFDIYIQGTLRQKNFNIMTEAGGVGKGINKTYRDIVVNGSTLEIFLYWAGKGTTAIPGRGVYGPLISAITVKPNFSVSNGFSVGAIVGIVIASFAVLASVLVLLKMKGYLGGKDDEDNNEFRGLDTGYFSLRQIQAATNDFNPINKIGEGGFGPVYKGVLPDGKVIAVKQLSAKSKQGNREFINEIGMISALQHPNLVKLHGCCIEGKELLLVYEYMVNNSLARSLFGREDSQINLDWATRKKICLGIARGLAYLHEESRLKIVHRDIKATNVLLDKDLNAKISDFGLAKLDEEENTHISTRIAGTIGYMAPEYAMRGYLTTKADIYSFGVVILEIVSGKSNTNYRPKEEFVYLLDWACVLQEQGNLLELVDPSLGSDYSEEEAMMLLNLALLCTSLSPSLRPNMSSVVSMILGEIPVQAPKVMQGAPTDELRFRAFERVSQDRVSEISMGSMYSNVQRSISSDGPWIDSTTSVQALDETRETTSSSSLVHPPLDTSE
ncbi:putative LRR receptor-like serine/threonine-protein kinase [Drosera capensis]